MVIKILQQILYKSIETNLIIEELMSIKEAIDIINDYDDVKEKYLLTFGENIKEDIVIENCLFGGVL